MNIISGRATGQYPLSLATSRAIESLNGILPDQRPGRPPIAHYEELWVNVKTLFRNMLTALDRESFATVSPEEVTHALAEEMETIPTLIRDNAPTLFVRYYLNEYIDMHELYPYSKIRVDNTNRQREILTLQRAALLPLEEHAEQMKLSLFIRKITPDDPKRSVIFTHMPYDLCSAPNFPSLDLVESFTGAIKPPSQWHTKYYSGKDYPQVPFREDFLQIFGDNETFSPLALKHRRAISDWAIQRRFSPVTTRDKIRYFIKDLPDETQQLLNSIMKV